jgi:hypothetical protein
MHASWTIPLLATGLLTSAVGADDRIPTPRFQGDFFNEMARAFACVVRVDVPAQTMTVVLDRDGAQVTVPIRTDTELHVRDSWGELGDYFPGQHVMLFMYVDEERAWTWPRAVQDELHVAGRHGWFARVTAIDRAALTYTSVRAEKDGQGGITREITATYRFDPAVKVWKGPVAATIDALAPGDEVIQQQVLAPGVRDGVKPTDRVVVEIADRAGDQAITAAQDARHRQDEDALGLPAYVTDVEVLTGAATLTVAWSSAARAKQLKPGEAVAIQPGGAGGKPFAASIVEVQGVDTRARLQVVINSRVASRLAHGQPLRLFMPGTGPALPTGRTGVPVFTGK